MALRALTLIAACLVALPARAATYHVAAGGDDSATGDATHPWATLQKAADTVTAGDTVLVHAGSYQGFDLRVGGSASAPITFQADPGVTLDADNHKTPDGINVEGDGSDCAGAQDCPAGNFCDPTNAQCFVGYVVIDGFTASGRTRAGIRLAVGAHNTVRHCVTDQNGTWGIFTAFEDDVLLEDNECSRSGTQHGIYTSNSGDRPTVRRNKLWGNAGCGLHMNGDVSQGGDGIISGALIEDNVIWENGSPGGGSGINCDGVQDSLFQNNLLYNNHASGLSLYQGDAAEPATNNVVVNNTIVMASDARWALNIKNASTGNTALDNILVNLSAHGAINIAADSLTGFASDYNAVTNVFSPDDGDSAFQSLAQWQTNTGQDQHSLVATPAQLFVDPPNNDYHLSPTSPAIDKGTASHAPAADLEGTPRTDGKIDIGCYERCPTCAGLDAGAPVPPDASAPAGQDAAQLAGADAALAGPDSSTPLTGSDAAALAGADAAMASAADAHVASTADGSSSPAGADGGAFGVAHSGCGCAMTDGETFALLGIAALVLRRRLRTAPTSRRTP